jgi:RNA polymerase sigma-70 factor (ECF subfamily)
LQDDKIIIQKLKIQDPEGLNEAIAKYSPLIVFIISKIIGMEKYSDVDECTSDVFMNLWKSASRFDETLNTSLKSYLCSIARYTAINYKRKSYKKSEIITIDEFELISEIDLESQVLDTDNQEILHNAINEMPSPDKEIFVLRFFYCFKIDEISEKLDLDKKKVENTLYRRKQKLRTDLLERGLVL